MKIALYIAIVSIILFLSSCNLATDKQVNSKSSHYYYSWNKKKIYFRKIDIYHTYIPVPTKIDKYEMSADAKTFEVFEEEIAKDKNHVYHQASIVEYADDSTFCRISESLYKDKNHMFYGLSIIEDADPETYTECYDQGGWAKDKNGYFYEGKRISVDIPTFEILSKFNNSAFDKDFIYYTMHDPIYKITIKGTLTKVNDKLLYDDYRLFRFISDNGYRLDTISIKNRKSFIVYDSVQNTIFKVNGKLYWNNLEIKDMLDINSFEYLGSSYAKDVHTVYYIRNTENNNVINILASDPATFKVIEKNLACDNQNVYYKDLIISDADPQTIRVTKKGLKDKNYEWKWNREKEKWDKMSIR